MGLTLFGYIFRDLVRVFVLAAAALAGVLSFAGLLRPLTEQGLGPGQAAKILAWLMPAMLVYSLPVAALFATTFVYGRLAADNESVAAKAAGITAGPTGLLLPAAVLGGLLGLGTIGLLGVVVPAANLQVEQTVWSNLARLTANQINRSNRATFASDAGDVTVFADRAILPDADTVATLVERAKQRQDDAGLPVASLSPDVQLVRLENAYVVRYPKKYRKKRHRDEPKVPDEIYAAGAATVFIDPPAYARSDSGARDAFSQSALARQEFVISVVLEDGVKFPRRVGIDGADDPNAGPAPLVAAARTARFGPVRRDVPVRLNPKFMGIGELRTLLREPEQSRRILDLVRGQTRLDQRVAYLNTLSKEAAGDGAELPGGDRTFTVSTGGQGYVDDLRLVYRDVPVVLTQRRDLPDGQTEVVEVWSERASIEAEPITPFGEAEPSMLVTFRLDNAAVTIDGHTTIGRDIERRTVIPMPESLAQLDQLTALDYLSGENVTLGGLPMTSGDQRYLLGKLALQNADVVGELHARAAFVVACLILPLLGGGLGLLTGTGNFLALSPSPPSRRRSAFR